MSLLFSRSLLLSPRPLLLLLFRFLPHHIFLLFLSPLFLARSVSLPLLRPPLAVINVRVTQGSSLFPLPCSPSLLSTWAKTKSSLREMGRKGGGWGEREAERENSNFQLREKGEKIRGVAPNGQEKRKEGKREGVSKKKGFYAHTFSLTPPLPSLLSLSLSLASRQ